MLNPSEWKSPQKQFSPVVVHDSPSNTQRNLTGISRQIKDNSADLYNCVQKWNENHVSGISALNKIRDIKFNLIEKKAEGMDLFPEALNEQCDILNNVYDALSGIADGLKLVHKQFQALKKLQDKIDQEPVFLTWSMSHYVELAEEVCRCYEEEARNKKYIKENIAFSDDKNKIEFYRISWIYQPFVDKGLDFRIESLLKETGHK